MENKSINIQAYGYLILTFVLWGSLYVVSKYILGKLPTFTISFLRFSIAFAVLTVTRKRSVRPVEKRDFPYLFLLGIGGYFIAVGAQLLGTKYAGASMASLLNSLNPVTMTLFAALILHEPFTKSKAAGIALALAGVYVILGGGGVNSPVGIGLSLFSVLFWSLVSVLMRRVTQKYDAISVTRYGVGIAALCYLPVCLWEIAETGGIHLDAPGILALLYMGVVCTGGAYYLWNKSLSLLDASTCSAFYPVQPLVSAGLGMLFLGEKTGLGFWIGALLIVAGIFVNLFGNGLLHT